MKKTSPPNGVEISPWLEAAALTLLISSYCWIQIRGLLVPGVYGDEAQDGVLAQQIIHAGFHHMGEWPLSNGGYHGALQAYLLAPFFLLIKEPLLALRIGELALSLIVIATAYLCAKRFFNSLAAVFTLVFLLSNPAFIFKSRMNTDPAGIMAAFYLGALICLLSWHRSGKSSRLFAAAFLAGAGFCLRLWFYWFYCGLILAALIFRGEAAHALGPRSASKIGGTALFFALGLSLYIMKEVRGEGTELFGCVLAHLHYGVRGADNFMILKNLGMRFGQLITELRGRILDSFPECYSNCGASLNLSPYAEMFCGALLALSFFCLIALGRGAYRRKGLFFVTLLFGMFLPSIFTLSDLVPEHLFILFPIPQIIMGAAAYLLFEHVLKTGRFWKAAALGLVLYALAPPFYAWEFSQMSGFVQRTGGTWFYSDANVGMVHWLKERGYFAPKNCDQRLDDPVRLLSNERIVPISCGQASYGTPDHAAAEAFLSQCVGGENVYLFLSPDLEHPSHSTLPYFSALLAGTGEKFALRKVFYDKNGGPAYGVYSLVPDLSAGRSRRRGPG